MRKWCSWLVFLLVLLTATGAYAFHAVAENHYLLPKGAVHHGDLAVSADRAVIEGTVDGDLYVFSRTVQVLGEVRGDILSFSANTAILGQVDGNIRAFTQYLTISGRVSRSVTSASQYVLITEPGVVQRNLLLFAANADLRGQVNGELNGMMGDLQISGKVGRGVSLLRAHGLLVHSTAVIGGDLQYSSPERAVLDGGAVIAGKERFTPITPHPGGGEVLPWLTSAACLSSTLLIWLSIRFLFPAGLQRVHEQLARRLAFALGIGVVVTLGAWMASLILLATVVGIPFSIILASAMIMLSYTAKVFIGSWLGRLFRDRFHWRIHPLLAELIGVFGLQCVLLIPFIGWLLAIPVWLAFFGAAAVAVRHANKTFPA